MGLSHNHMWNDWTMNDTQIQHARQFAWLSLIVFVGFGIAFSYLLYDTYSTRDTLRAERIAVHLNHVRDIRSLPPTADGLTNAATQYLKLGGGAIFTLYEADGIIMWCLVGAIGLCVGAIMLPLRVLRTVVTRQTEEGK